MPIGQHAPYYVGQTRIFVNSPRYSTKDISKIVTEVKIFENIGLPYLTAQLIIIDSANASNAATFIGQERVVMTVLDENLQPIIAKEWICMGIEGGQKVNDGVSVYVVKLIEEHAMLSNSTRFSKTYEGKPEAIANKVTSEQLGVSISTEGSYQSNMRVNFPFTTNPLSAAMWMTSRCTTAEGAPFYLYSTMVDDSLQMKSLSTLLAQGPFNSRPFTFARTSDKEIGGPEDYEIVRHKISGYTIGDTEDSLLAMTRNVYGAYYHFLETHEFGGYEFIYDLPTPLNKMPKPNGTTVHNYDPAFTIGRPYHEGQNTYSTQIVTRKLFEDGIFSYNEEEVMERHKRKGESQALYNFMARSPINVSIPGKGLGGFDKLGKVADIYITKDIPIDEEGSSRESVMDKKKSGKYLVYAIKHVIFNNQWTSTLTATKLDTDPALSGEDGKLNKA